MKRVMTYDIVVSKTYSKTVSVDAESAEEALEKVRSVNQHWKPYGHEIEDDWDEPDFEVIASYDSSTRRYLLDKLDNLSNEQKFALHNAVCDHTGEYAASKYYKAEQIMDFVSGKTIEEVIDFVGHGFDKTKPCFYFEEGYPHSLYTWELDFDFATSEMVASLIEDGETFGLDFIEDMIKEN